MVEYSKHIETDENATIKPRACESLLKGLSRNIKQTFLLEETFFAEFESAVAAVECAVEFQMQLKKK